MPEEELDSILTFQDPFQDCLGCSKSNFNCAVNAAYAHSDNVPPTLCWYDRVLVINNVQIGEIFRGQQVIYLTKTQSWENYASN